MFVRRDKAGRGAHLEWRIRLFGAGAILAMVGIYYEARWMIWVAIAVLTAGFLLRFLGGGGAEEDSEDDDSQGSAPNA